jgi:hypothetical protein
MSWLGCEISGKRLRRVEKVLPSPRNIFYNVNFPESLRNPPPRSAASFASAHPVKKKATSIKSRSPREEASRHLGMKDRRLSRRRRTKMRAPIRIGRHSANLPDMDLAG